MKWQFRQNFGIFCSAVSRHQQFMHCYPKQNVKITWSCHISAQSAKKAIKQINFPVCHSITKLPQSKSNSLIWTSQCRKLLIITELRATFVTSQMASRTDDVCSVQIRNSNIFSRSVSLSWHWKRLQPVSPVYDSCQRLMITSTSHASFNESNDFNVEQFLNAYTASPESI